MDILYLSLERMVYDTPNASTLVIRIMRWIYTIDLAFRAGVFSAW